MCIVSYGRPLAVCGASSIHENRQDPAMEGEETDHFKNRMVCIMGPSFYTTLIQMFLYQSWFIED